MSDVTYRCAFPPLVKDWEDGAVIFNRLTGATHVLDTIAAEILSRIVSEPQTAEQLATSIPFSDLTIEVGQDPVSLIDATLREMDELGLVEPVVR